MAVWWIVAHHVPVAHLIYPCSHGLTALAIFAWAIASLFTGSAQFPGGISKHVWPFVSTWLLLRNYGTLMAPDGVVSRFCWWDIF